MNSLSKNKNAIRTEALSEVVISAIFGVIIGDALGVPVEFTPRFERKEDPVTGMLAYGTHSQPKGTWSDDSSMMLATVDSMVKCNGIDYDDIMMKFQEWRLNGKYTPFGRAFDVGISCGKAIAMYRPGADTLKCGGLGDRDNGNGSLMRIMPVSLLYAIKKDYWNPDVLFEAITAVQNVSRLTHAHPRSLIACVLYTSICHELIYRGEAGVTDAVQTAVSKTLDYYESDPERFASVNSDFPGEISRNTYSRLRDISGFKDLSEDEIQSSGYVVHTIEAAVWCLLNSGSFSECVLKAVNLGDDTDTVGAVTGGLAGLFYGFDEIPSDWVEVLAQKEMIDRYCRDFSDHIGDTLNGVITGVRY